MVQFGQRYLIGFPKTGPGATRVRVPAVSPVDCRALCGRGVRTLLGCRSSRHRNLYTTDDKFEQT